MGEHGVESIRALTDAIEDVAGLYVQVVGRAGASVAPVGARLSGRSLLSRPEMGL